MSISIDVLTTQVTFDDSDPPRFRGGEAAAVRALGGGELTVRVYELPAGVTLCPYHYEYVEEWLLVLSGELGLRGPDGRSQLAAGGLVRFPSGPAGAHQVWCEEAAAQAARIMMFSSAREPAVAVYPDSAKIGVWVPGSTDNLMVRRADGDVPYYDGEVSGVPSE